MYVMMCMLQFVYLLPLLAMAVVRTFLDNNYTEFMKKVARAGVVGMDLVERLIAESSDLKVKDEVRSCDMSHLSGLRYGLKAVSGHNCPTRDIGVQHKAGARVAKMKQVQACTKSCSASHCLIASHGKKVAELDDDDVNAKEHLFDTMLDWSWTEFEEYKQQMFDDLPIKEDKLISLLCAVNTDLTEVGASCCEGPVCLG